MNRRGKTGAGGPEPVVPRRTVLAATGGGIAALVALTAGQSFHWLAFANLLAPRVQGLGPQSLPVNKTARAAGVTQTAADPGWRLSVANGTTAHAYSLSRLRALPQASAQLPIACVEGWSTSAHWQGVRMRDLVADVGGTPSHSVRVTSLERQGAYRVMTMGPEFVQDPTTLVALELNGQPLNLDHGYPARIIAPGRPGVLQTKWIETIEVLS